MMISIPHCSVHSSCVASTWWVLSLQKRLPVPKRMISHAALLNSIFWHSSSQNTWTFLDNYPVLCTCDSSSLVLSTEIWQTHCYFLDTNILKGVRRNIPSNPSPLWLFPQLIQPIVVLPHWPLDGSCKSYSFTNEMKSIITKYYCCFK